MPESDARSLGRAVEGEGMARGSEWGGRMGGVERSQSGGRGWERAGWESGERLKSYVVKES